ncbi:sugar ABC transporter substrate-binding protein [Streptomyces sp. Isolate_45]|uniref:ABC transporter substrate-binding protein n=1 Tax=Streptomyces sp. Isolate_45 TaxID=2950111 RepID=UPI0024820111|nr:sugar ABC transporter substrate-binding protein [Streptomyces sp. Isolate_45]MDA5282521.1 sugar ABC transporter substrate-binding protein [Streptomyces sp. Isolate_45]
MRSLSLSRRRALRAGATLTAATLCATLLAACGSSGDSTAAAEDGKPVSLTFWGWAKGTKEVVDAFNASHPNTRVAFEEIPAGNAGGYAKLSNAVKAGNAPDVFNVEYPQLPDFVSQGAVQDISKLVGADLKAKYLPQATELTSFGGRTWALPLDSAPQAFYYRKDLFEKAGITVPKTWEEFRTAAQKLKAANPETRIATFFPDDPTIFEALAWQNGARLFSTAGEAWKSNLTGPESRKVAAYWQQLVDEDLVRVQPSFSQQWTASLQKGETAGYVGASWGAGVLKSNLGTTPDINGKWAVAQLPGWDGAPASGMLGGTTFAVSKGSKKAKAAVEFATWATTTPEGIRARIASGTSSSYPAATELIPVAKQAFNTDFYGGQDIYAVYAEAAKSIRPGWTWGPAMGVTNGTLKDSFGKVAGKTGTIDNALAAAQQTTLAEFKKRGLKVAQ